MNLITFNSDESIITPQSKNKLNKLKNIFIGDWCIEKKNIYEVKKNSFIKTYNPVRKKIVKKNIKYQKKIYSIILKNVTKSLNKYHNTNYDNEYWELLLNRWLWIYISQLFFRWKILEKLLKKKNVSSYSLLSFDDKDFIPDNTQHSRNIITSYNSYWSHWIFTKIILSKKKIKRKIIIDFDKYKFYKIIKSLSAVNFYHKLLNFDLKKRKIFFYEFVLNKNLKFKLMLSNLYFTYKLFKKTLKFTNEKKEKKRKNFYKYRKTKDTFLNFSNMMVDKNLPKIFLENYSCLEKTYQNLDWPKNPKYICTTHGHFFNEIFKIYVAKKRKEGAKLLIMQHGAAGFYSDNFYTNYYDEKISDRYLSWGTKTSKKTFRLFPNLVINKKTKPYIFDIRKNIVLILLQMPDIPTRPPDGFNNQLDKNIIKIKSITEFYKKLPNNFKKKVICKILNLGKYDTVKNSIIKNFPKIKFLNNKKPIHSLVNDFNLNIHFYLSTSFFETIILNKPSILILKTGIIDELDNQFLKDLRILKKYHICFEDSAKAAKFVKNNYLNLDKWWNDESTQAARKNFCIKYCRESEDHLKDFNRALKF